MVIVSGEDMKTIQLFLLIIGCGSSVCGLTPDAARAVFVAEQIDDPYNPVLSYNLGIAALNSKKMSDAERHFSLATELYDRTDTRIIPAYFSWADTAALELIAALRDKKELKGSGLDRAISRATDASNRYGNVLVFDANHTAAQERKKIVDKLKSLLEARKQEQKEQEDQKDQKKDQQQNSGNQEQDRDDQEQDPSGNENDSSQPEGSNNKNNTNSSHQDKKQPSSKQEQSEQEQSEQEQSEQEQSSSQDDKNTQSDASNAQDTNAGDTDDHADSDEHGSNSDEQQKGDQQTANELDHTPSATDREEQEASAGQDVGTQDDALAPEEQQPPVVAKPREYDANAEMAKKRALVLLDKVQHNEAALQKAQLLKKTNQQGLGNERFNQW